MTQSTVLPTPTNGKEASKPQTVFPLSSMESVGSGGGLIDFLV